MLQTTTKEQYLVTQKIVYEGVSKEDGILKMDISKKMPSDVKQSCGLIKKAKPETKGDQTV